ncbi:hypothetical protein FS837_000056 [Tulasnella sp. UAMH 9824]|nr:hypothetical protein FS837_000056 [Tulasnella sp. UAMH 9824]
MLRTISSPGMESEFSNDSRGSPPSSSSATSVSADSFLSTGIDNSPFASFQPHPMASMSPSSSTSGPDLASLFPGMVNNLQIGQQDPRRSAAETSIAGSSATSASSAFAQSLSYPLGPADNGAGRFIQGAAAHNLSDPLAFLDQPPHSSIMHSQSHLQHQHQAFHHPHHQHQQQQHHAHVPSHQRHRAFTTSAASDPAAILSIHRPSSATATSSSATMFDPLDLSSYAMAGVAGAAPGYGISGVEELASGPAIDSPTTGHQQQGHPSPMNTHAAAGSGSPPSLTHRDSLSSNSSENTEVGAKESTPSALSDPASAAGAATAGDDTPAPPVVKAGRKLPKPVTDFLRKWLLEHADHPYPNEQEKKMLCEKTGLTMHQLSNWMINARRRILVPASKVIQTIGSSPYNMGQRRSTSALAAAHAYRVVDPSSTTGPSGSATGPAPSHYIPHLLPEQLAAGVQRSQRGLAPSSAGVVVGSQTASPGLQGQAAQPSGAALPGRGLQRSGTFPPPVTRDPGFYSSSSPSASSATGSTSSSASPSIPAHPSVPIPPRLLPSHIMAPQPVYPVSAPASAGSPASAGAGPGYPSPTASGAAQQGMMNAYARREAELAAYASEFRMLQQQATQQHSFNTLQHAMVPRQQQQPQQGQFPGQQGSQMGSTSSAGIAYPPGQNPSAGGGSSAGFFNF